MAHPVGNAHSTPKRLPQNSHLLNIKKDTANILDSTTHRLTVEKKDQIIYTYHVQPKNSNVFMTNSRPY